ncbi:MAG: alpha/beta hydrolase [Alphaproteobacteria bacterium]
MIKKVCLAFGVLLVLFVAAIVFWPEKSYTPYEVAADYQAQVDAFDLPSMPPDWKWKAFAAEDGTVLRWGETGNSDAAKATVLFVPGYTASVDMYGEHADFLARQGYHVIGFDLRGQGGSERHRKSRPEKLWVDDFSAYSDDLAGFIKAMKRRDGQPVILAASSFGGHVAVRAAGDHTLGVDGLYLLAPALRPKSDPYTFEQAKRLMTISRLFGKSKNYVYGQTDWRPDGLDFTQGSDCSSYPKRLYLRDALFTRRPEQRVGGITNQFGAEFFESSDYVLQSGYLEKIDMPVSVISAVNDTFVLTDTNSQACSERFPNCREITPPKSGHCLLQEDDATLGLILRELESLVERINRQ